MCVCARVCFPVLKASIASSPLHSTSHPSITEWERGTDSIAWSQQSSRASSREKERKWETQNKGSGGRGRQSQVWRREIQKDRAREHERDANATQRSCPLLWLSSITLSVFSPSLWLPSWPFGSVTPVSAAISQPGPVTLVPAHMQPALEGRVSSAELEPHTVVVRQSRSCDGLNVTVELLTFGPETTDGNRQPEQQRPCTHGYSIQKHNQSNTHTHTHSDVALSVNECV